MLFSKSSNIKYLIFYWYSTRIQTVEPVQNLTLPVGVGGGTTSTSDGGKPVTMGVWGPFTITWPR